MRKLFFLFLLFSSTGYSQTWDWARNFSWGAQDIGTSIGADKYGNIYITGNTSYFTGGGGSYYYELFVKLDSVGNQLLVDTLPFMGTKSVTDKDGNTYLISGSQIAKYNSMGIQMWLTTSPGKYFHALAIYPSGGVVAVGNTNINNQSKGIIYRYDSIGNEIWYSTGKTPWCNVTACDINGNIYVGGTGDRDTITGNMGFLAKFDSVGILKFCKTVPHFITAIALDRNNNIFLSGYIGIYPININGAIYTCPSSEYGCHLIKYDSHGDILWFKLFSGNLGSYGIIATDKSNNIYYSTGYGNLQVDNINLTAKTGEVITFQFDNAGNIKWFLQSCGDTNTMSAAYPEAIFIKWNDEVLLTGTTEASRTFGSTTLSASGYSDILVAKLSQPDVSFTAPTGTKNSFFTIYPNPSSSIVTINYSLQEKGNLEVKITNVKGQTIFAESISLFTGEYTKDIDLSKYAKGIYLVEIIANRKRTIRKLVLD